MKVSVCSSEDRIKSKGLQSDGEPAGCRGDEAKAGRRRRRDSGPLGGWKDGEVGGDWREERRVRRRQTIGCGRR